MKTRFILALVNITFLLVFFAACKNEGTKTDTDSQATTDTTAQESAAAAEYRLTPAGPSTDFPDAALKNMTYKNGTFSYQVSGTKYKLKEQTPDAPQKMCANSAEGQHIHLIVDNEPYVAKYEPSFQHDVADGVHYILSFLSRSYHESLKHKEAHIAKKVTVANKSVTKTEDIKEPMLFYSRPKGNYTGKAETDKILVDFYLLNATLGADYKVKMLVNNEQEFMIDNWQPYFLEGLPMGDNKIQLTLIDKDGNTVQTSLNPVERVFTLVGDPAEAQ